VTAPEFKNLADDITESRTKVIESETKLARMTVKGRFLQYLSSKDDGADELREECIICLGSSDDKNGVLLECGHFFCRVSHSTFCESRLIVQSCFRELRRARQRNCPSCRTLSELASRCMPFVPY
jgi:E3 ubiquitin-protein ligase SHPRH